MFFSLLLLLGGVLGLVLPSVGKHLEVFILPSLFVLMFFTALKVDFLKLTHSIKKPKILLIGIAISYLLIPFFLYSLASVLHLDETQQLSVLFSALAPTILSAPYFVSIMKGDVEFSFILSVVLTLLAPFIIPLEIFVYIGKEVELELFGIFKSIFLLVFIPVVSVYLIRKRATFLLVQLEKIEGLVTAIMFFVFTWAVIASNADMILGLSDFMLVITLIALLQEFGFFFIVRFISRRFMSDALSKSFAFSVTIKNTVLTAGIAMLYSSELALVSALVVLLHVPMFAYIMYKKESL